MSSLLFIILVAVANLCLGFATAVVLGQARAWPRRPRAGATPEGLPRASAENVPAETELPVEDELDDLTRAESRAEAPAGRPCSVIEQAIRTLQPLAREHRNKIEQVDIEVRRAIAQHDLFGLQEQSTRLIELSRKLFHDHTEASGILQDTSNTPRPLASVAQQMQRESESQLDVLRTAMNELDEQDLGAADAGEQLLNSIMKLIESSHLMRDAIDDALLEIARIENRIDDLSPQERTDLATQLPNRAGLEQQLSVWWKEDPQRARPLSIGLMDVDRCSKLNRGRGAATADNALVALANLLSNRLPKEATVVRMMGQQWVFVFPDCDLAEAAGHMELLRQSIEQSQIEHAGSSFQMTVSCAVVQASDNDTVDRLLDRANSTLQEAKGYGRNRTFLYEQECPTPVVPPDLAVSAASISI